MSYSIDFIMIIIIVLIIKLVIITIVSIIKLPLQRTKMSDIPYCYFLQI